MKTIRNATILWIALAALMGSGCATVPIGPSVTVLPGTGKSFEQFQADDALCRRWAGQQVGTTTGQVAQESTATGAALGTALGAVGGALLGAASGHAGGGAAVGAGIGLLGGTAIGAGNAQEAGSTVQGRYDSAYMQCMYAKGNQIPVAGAPYRGYASRPSYAPPPPPPASSLPPGVPPPPPGPPPPPPEGPTQ